MRQLILAKAAMQTGVFTLLETLNLPKEQISHLYIAGAFGSHINSSSARIIGIIPEIDLGKVQSVGNAAGTGARMCLLSKHAKELADQIAGKIEYIELAANKSFQSTFLNSNFLPNSDFSKYPETTSLLKKYGHFPKKPPRIF
jgi:uncharacterized 2Fe-2S/4Fe-4S cluster protein (DUF4445 family)